MSQHFDKKISFPTSQKNNEHIKNGKIIPLKERMKQTIVDNHQINDLEYEKDKVFKYCDSLFVFWKTNFFIEEVTQQILQDVALLIKIWDNKTEERYFQFWSKAFGGK